jgi:hypothetical protein
MMSMRREMATPLDSERGEYYVDFDRTSGRFGVFGTYTSFCYSKHTEREDAEDAALRMTENAGPPRV